MDIIYVSRKLQKIKRYYLSLHHKMFDENGKGVKVFSVGLKRF